MLRLGERLRDEDGNILVIVVLVSMLVGMLAALTLTTGEQADRASARDRNHEVALGVTEAGVHEAITQIEERLKDPAYFSDLPTITGSTAEGSYTADVERVGDGFAIEARGKVGGDGQFERNRHVKVTLRPPELFPDAGYALFSKTNLYLKNNNEVYEGDVWANDSLWAEAGAIIEGSVTSAQSWVKVEQGADITGYLWAGGRKCETFTGTACTSGWGIDLGQNTTIGQWAKSSISAVCGSESPNEYDVITGNNAQISGDLTLPPGSSLQGPGTVGPPGQIVPDCTTAQPRKDPEPFTYLPQNYDPATLVECPSPACPGSDGAAAFQSWLDTGGRRDALEGTFVITECSGRRINIDGADLAGDVTIISNPVPCSNGIKGARIYADNVSDDALAAGEKAKFILVSHYEPTVVGNPGNPEGFCTDKDDTYCAISAKNHFDPTCEDPGVAGVSFLVYADNGPVSMKNETGNEQICGSVIANGIHMKNGLQLTYDPLLGRPLGFGPNVYEIVRWEELPS